MLWLARSDGRLLSVTRKRSCRRQRRLERQSADNPICTYRMKPERRNRSPKLSVCWIGQCFNRVRSAVRARGWDCFRLRTESLALTTINMSWRSTSLFVVTSRHGPTIERMLLKEHEVAKVGDIPAWAARAHDKSSCLCGVPASTAQNVWLVEKPFNVQRGRINAPRIPESHFRLLDPDIVVDEHLRKYLPTSVVFAIAR